MSKRERALAEALIASLVGYVVAGFFLSQAYSAYLYATAGILTGLVAASGMRMRKPPGLPQARLPQTSRRNPLKAMPAQ